MKKFVVTYRNWSDEMQDQIIVGYKEFKAYAPALAHAKGQSKKYDRCDVDLHEVAEGEEFNTLTMRNTIVWSESYKNGVQIPRTSINGEDIMRWDLKDGNLVAREASLFDDSTENEPDTQSNDSAEPEAQDEEQGDPFGGRNPFDDEDPETEPEEEQTPVNDPEPETTTPEAEPQPEPTLKISEPEPIKQESSAVEIGNCYITEDCTKIIKVTAVHKSFTRHEAIWSTGKEVGFYENKSLLTDKVAQMKRYDSALYETKRAEVLNFLQNGIIF